MIQLKDKSKNCNISLTEKDIQHLRYLCDRSIKTLAKKDGIIVFSPKGTTYNDDFLIRYYKDDNEGDVIQTGNWVGFLGVNGTEINIRSSYDDNEGNYFVRYMLQKTYKLNITNLTVSGQMTENDPINYLMYMFPSFLKDAIAQGLFKSYQTHRYNDSNMRGTLNVTTHIRKNVPFNGRVAFSVREHCYDNPITQLIRHTIEHIKKAPEGRELLSRDYETKAAVNTIVSATPSYNRNRIQMVLMQNRKMTVHPYFDAYIRLQQLCKLLLNHNNYSQSENGNKKIYGFLINAADIWEVYLAKVLENKFEHYEYPCNKFPLFDNGDVKLIPDYISKDNSVVADAKYISLQEKLGREQNMEVYYKTIVYMYRLDTDIGFLFYPLSDSSAEKQAMRVVGNQGVIYKIGLKIPQSSTDYREFVNAMKQNESEFIKHIKW